VLIAFIPESSHSSSSAGGKAKTISEFELLEDSGLTENGFLGLESWLASAVQKSILFLKQYRGLHIQVNKLLFYNNVQS